MFLALAQFNLALRAMDLKWQTVSVVGINQIRNLGSDRDGTAIIMCELLSRAIRQFTIVFVQLMWFAEFTLSLL